MAAQDWLAREPHGNMGLVRSADGRVGLAEGVGAASQGGVLGGMPHGATGLGQDGSHGWCWEGGMSYGKGGAGVGCSPWSRMCPPPRTTLQGEMLSTIQFANCPPAWRSDAHESRWDGDGKSHRAAMPPSLLTPQTPRVGARWENTPADPPFPHLGDTPNPHVSDPAAARSHPARLQPHRWGLTQLQRVRACSIPPDTEPWLRLITQEPSRRISCEKLPAVSCRGEGGTRNTAARGEAGPDSGWP